MPHRELREILCSPAAARPVVLEGQWLGRQGRPALAAMHPVSVLEGSEEALAEFPAWTAWHVARHPRGAAIGWLSYELARFFERLPLCADPSIPDLSFAYYPHIEEIPSHSLRFMDISNGAEPEVRTNFNERGFAAAVEAIRRYIAAGDIYQANFTQQFTVKLDGLSAETIFGRLSEAAASFRAFLKTPLRTVISNSPERFFRVSGGCILASPIKGTMARGAEPNEDAARAQALLASAKNRAENIMIVDLLRNDLGRICRYATIRTQVFQIDPLPHLFHLVSHVQGELGRSVGVGEILAALFPCGSITGAPKIRAMEILAEIEQVPRGVSMGSLGIIRASEDSGVLEMDFNVAIRTMTVRDAVATFNVGGGIVYDSVAEEEYEEMMLKARPLLEALGVPAAAPRTLQALTLER